MSIRKRSDKGRIFLRALALLFSVLPPALAVIFYFPLWKHTSAEKLLSGGTLLLLIFAAIPLFRIILGRIKTPAAHTLWLMIFLLFYLLSSIAKEMIVISFTGFLGNLIGAVLFRLSRRSEVEE